MNRPKYVMNRPNPPEGEGVFAFLALIMHRPLRDESSVSGKKWERKVKSLAAGVLVCYLSIGQ